MSIFQLSGELTLTNAQTMLNAGMAALLAGQTDFDFSGLSRVDSSAVVTMLAWLRDAEQRGVNLNFFTLSPQLHSLLDLYGLQAVFASSIRH